MNTGDSEVSFIVMNPSGGKKEKELLDGKAKKKEDAASPALAPMASAMGAAAMMGKEPLTKPKEGSLADLEKSKEHEEHTLVLHDHVQTLLANGEHIIYVDE